MQCIHLSLSLSLSLGPTTEVADKRKKQRWNRMSLCSLWKPGRSISTAVWAGDILFYFLSTPIFPEM